MLKFYCNPTEGGLLIFVRSSRDLYNIGPWFYTLSVSRHNVFAGRHTKKMISFLEYFLILDIGGRSACRICQVRSVHRLLYMHVTLWHTCVPCMQHTDNHVNMRHLCVMQQNNADVQHKCCHVDIEDMSEA